MFLLMILISFDDVGSADALSNTETSYFKMHFRLKKNTLHSSDALKFNYVFMLFIQK